MERGVYNQRPEKREPPNVCSVEKVCRCPGFRVYGPVERWERRNFVARRSYGAQMVTTVELVSKWSPPKLLFTENALPGNHFCLYSCFLVFMNRSEARVVSGAYRKPMVEILGVERQREQHQHPRALNSTTSHSRRKLSLWWSTDVSIIFSEPSSSLVKETRVMRMPHGSRTPFAS